MSMPITEHFELQEFSCHDGTPYPIDQIDDEDPQGRTWLETRLAPLCETLEAIRGAAGFERIFIDSGYRTIAYDSKLYAQDAGRGNVATPQGSQHPKGRAADIRHEILTPVGLHDIILSEFLKGRLPRLGGLGLYSGFVHVDVRPRPPTGHLAQWTGTRVSNQTYGCSLDAPHLRHDER